MQNGSYKIHLQELFSKENLGYFYSEKLDSTNNQAKRILVKDPSFVPGVVVANCQSAGRGRRGNSFASPANTGLYMSLVFCPNFSEQEFAHTTSYAAVVCCNVIRELLKLEVCIKGTNDLVLDGAKVGGILTEACQMRQVAQSLQVSQTCRARQLFHPLQVSQTREAQQLSQPLQVSQTREAQQLSQPLQVSQSQQSTQIRQVPQSKQAIQSQQTSQVAQLTHAPQAPIASEVCPVNRGTSFSQSQQSPQTPQDRPISMVGNSSHKKCIIVGIGINVFPSPALDIDAPYKIGALLQDPLKKEDATRAQLAHDIAVQFMQDVSSIPSKAYMKLYDELHI